MNDIPPPVVLALVVADDVSIDPATNKPTARGVFFDVNAAIPVSLDFSVLVTVTEVRRPARISVAVPDPEDNPIHGANWTVAGNVSLRHVRGVEFVRPTACRYRATGYTL